MFFAVLFLAILFFAVLFLTVLFFAILVFSRTILALSLTIFTVLFAVLLVRTFSALLFVATFYGRLCTYREGKQSHEGHSHNLFHKRRFLGEYVHFVKHPNVECRFFSKESQ